MKSFSRKTSRKIISLICALLFVTAALILLLFAHVKWQIVLIVTILESAALLIVVISNIRNRKQRMLSISNIIGEDGMQSLIYAKTGMIVYDNDYIIQYVSEYLQQQGFKGIGKKLTMVFEESQALFDGNVERIIIDFNDRKYEFTKAETCQIVYVKDVTDLLNLKEDYNNEMIVLGLVNIDNYEEIQQYEDEQTLTLISSNIIQKVINWAISYQAVIRKLRNDRYMIVTDKKNFQNMLDSRFVILNEIKEYAEEIGVNITLSMAFTSGDSNLSQLNATLNSLIELVLSRGGDQVVYKEKGREDVFFGGNSQASEKRSKIQARVMAKTIKNIAVQSDTIFVVGHDNGDMDSIASTLALCTLFRSYDKEVYAVIDDINIEPVTANVLDANIEEIRENYQILTPARALNMLTKDCTVFAVDHHTLDMSAAKELLAESKRNVIIDHHRRKSENMITAMLIYNEPSASSTVELISEIMQYQDNEIELDELLSTMMYAGILVDTDHLKVHCTSRSFEACSFLVNHHCDVIAANDMLKDSYQDFMTRNLIMKYCKNYKDRILIAAVDEKHILSRTAVSAAADYMANVSDVRAAFVIARVSEEICSISARSQNNVNVQVILEKMGGGGHFNAAGVQKSGATVAQMEEELKEAVEAYLQEVVVNEDNSVG